MKSTHRPSLVSSFCVTVLFLVAEGVSEKITAQPVQDYRPKIGRIFCARICMRDLIER